LRIYKRHLNNEEKKLNSRREILRVLADAVPYGLRFTEIQGRTNLSSKTISNYLKDFKAEGSIVPKDGSYYVTDKGIHMLNSIMHDSDWSRMLTKPKAMIFGNQQIEGGDIKGFTAAYEAETPYPFGDKEVKRRITKITGEYLKSLSAVMGEKPYKVNIKATIAKNKWIYYFAEEPKNEE